MNEMIKMEIINKLIISRVYDTLQINRITMTNDFKK